MYDAWRRMKIGFGWGLVAAMEMAILMGLASVLAISPMPTPFPLAIIRALLGASVAAPIAIGLAVLAHFGFGALWGGMFAAVVKPVTVAKGVALGVLLWFVSQTLVMPLIGWGAFGGAVSPIIWFATLVVHVAYGVTLGLAIDRHGRAATVSSSAMTAPHGHVLVGPERTRSYAERRRSSAH